MNIAKNQTLNLLKKWSDKVMLGKYQLKNRIVLAAMTRQRCDIENGIANQVTEKYYAQRSGAGLLITQSSSWSQRGNGFPGAADIYTKPQSQGWKRVIESIHKRDSRIYVQMNHCGRASSTAATRGLDIWAPSAIKIRDLTWSKQQHEAPHQMTQEQIKITQEQFRNSIKLAKQSGFDGIQLHGAHGYLIDQFLRSMSNKRTDNYGGSVQNRCRFALELVDIALQFFQPYQIGIKISPVSRYNDMYDDNPVETFTYLTQQLNVKKIGFIEVRQSIQPPVSAQVFPKLPLQQFPDICQGLRPHFNNGLLIVNEQVTEVTGLQKIAAGKCDLASFGRLYISNPDLAQRIINNLQFNTNLDFYTLSRGMNGQNLQQKGYTDYPFYEQYKKSKTTA